MGEKLGDVYGVLDKEGRIFLTDSHNRLLADALKKGGLNREVNVILEYASPGRLAEYSTRMQQSGIRNLYDLSRETIPSSALKGMGIK